MVVGWMKINKKNYVHQKNLGQKIPLEGYILEQFFKLVYSHLSACFYYHHKAFMQAWFYFIYLQSNQLR